jgi:hypothetical protein
MYASSLTDIIPRTWQAIGTKQTMTMIFLTGRKLIVLSILPKGSKFNQLYFADYILPDLQKENVDFHHRIPQATFSAHKDSSICHNGPKVASKFEKHHVF